jgi:hypothetical protein
MIPATVLVTRLAEAAEASTGDATLPMDGDTEGQFAAALQLLLANASDTAVASVPDAAPGTAVDAKFAADVEAMTDMLSAQPAPDATASGGLSAAPLAAPPAEDLVPADALQWLMLMQAAVPMAPVVPPIEDTVDATFAATLSQHPTEIAGEEAVLLAASGLEPLLDERPVTGPLFSDALPSEPPDLGVMTAANAEVKKLTLLDAALDRGVADSVRAPGLFEPDSVPRTSSESVTHRSPPPVLTPFRAPDWSHEFAARVNWVVERGDQVASIRLTPEQLGPVEVRVAIREGEASIWFGAAQAETRAAIQEALPRLREMLAANGLALADSGVFQQAPHDPRQGFLQADARRVAGESAGSSGERLLASRHLGLIDDYA